MHRSHRSCTTDRMQYDDELSMQIGKLYLLRRHKQRICSSRNMHTEEHARWNNYTNAKNIIYPREHDIIDPVYITSFRPFPHVEISTDIKSFCPNHIIRLRINALCESVPRKTRAADQRCRYEKLSGEKRSWLGVVNYLSLS